MVQKVDFPNIVVEPENRCLYYLNFEAEKTAVSRKSVRIHNRMFCLWKTCIYRWFRAFLRKCTWN